MSSLLKLVVFASGSGTTLQTVINNIRCGEIDAKISLVVSNNAEAGALTRAKIAGINTHVIKAEANQTSEIDFELLEVIEPHEPDLILLLGYLWKVGRKLTRRYSRQIVNTHPALLPDFGGPKMYGDRVHAAVLATGKKESGATLHYVVDDDEYDTGPIICQTRVKVEPSDTVQTLSARVQAAEKIQLVEWLQAFSFTS